MGRMDGVVLYAWSGALLNLHLGRHRFGYNWSYETLSWCLHCKQGSFPVFSPARDGSSRALHEWLHIPRNESCKMARNKHGWMNIWWSRVKWSISMGATSWKSKARAQIMSNSSAKNRFISFWWITVKCQLFYNWNCSSKSVFGCLFSWFYFVLGRSLIGFLAKKLEDNWSSKCSLCTNTSRHLWDFISSLGSQSRSAGAVHKHWQRLSNLDRLPYTVQGFWKWIQSLQASIITGSQEGTWTMNI